MRRRPPGLPAIRAVICGLLVLALAAAPLDLRAADWPQWRGPLRIGISKETGLLSKWPAGGPKRVWTASVGEGFSSVAVANGRLYTMGNDGSRDTVYCLNAVTGKKIWTHSYPCESGDHSGPRATPTLYGTLLYTFSREGHAFCLNAATGKPVWAKNLNPIVGESTPEWGFAGSPLVLGSLVLYNAGAAGIALDRHTGVVKWRSGNGPAGYSSPLWFKIGTQRGVALFSGKGLVAVDPANGRVLWRCPWDTSYDVNAADPVFLGNTVFISSNYGRGGARFAVSGSRTTKLWENRNMRNHFSTGVLVGGYLYGNDENTLKCLDLQTGAERWRLRGIGKGGLIAADGKLIVLTERGELIFARAAPDRYTEIARASVLDGTCWTAPALANGLLYLRNHEGTLVCLNVRGKG